jgi:hypothetical protein
VRREVEYARKQLQIGENRGGKVKIFEVSSSKVEEMAQEI